MTPEESKEGLDLLESIRRERQALAESTRELHGLLKDSRQVIAELKKVAISKGMEAGKFAEELVTGSLEKHFPRISQEIDRTVNRCIDEVNDELVHLLHCLGKIAGGSFKPPTVKEVATAHEILTRAAHTVGDEQSLHQLQVMKMGVEESMRNREQKRKRKR